MRLPLLSLGLLGTLGILPILGTYAVDSRPTSDDPWCQEADATRPGAEPFCEIREFTLPSGSVRTRVLAFAPTEAAARQLVSDVEIEASDALRPLIPATRDDAWVGVSVQFPVEVEATRLSGDVALARD